MLHDLLKALFDDVIARIIMTSFFNDKTQIEGFNPFRT